MNTLPHLLQNAYQTVPDKTSIILQFAGQKDKTINYRDLIHGANRYAQTYANKGIKRGEVIILILQHGEDLIYSFWGAILHGAIPSIMPFLTEKLAPEKYRADLASLISITKPTTILTYPEFENEIRGALVEGDSVKNIILTSTLAEDGELSKVDFDSLQGMNSSQQDIVVLQHSSGTTGLQKGVALSHRAILNQLNSYSETIQLNKENDVIVSWLPLYHDMGFIACFIMPVILQIPLVLMSPFDWVRAPYKLLQSVSQYKGTLSWLPNFAFNFCAQKIRERNLENVNLSTWRAIINCSEPVHVESHNLFFEKFSSYGLNYSALQTCYAMAENVFAVTQSPLDKTPVIDEIDRETFMTQRLASAPIVGQATMKMTSSGHPLSNVKIRVVDESFKDVNERVVGEIAVQSDCMLTEYFNRPDATESAIKDGWYLTGDYGYLVNGELYVSGRKKDLIIVGGKNVYPQDLESLAGAVTGVRKGRCVAFGMYDQESGTEEVVIIAESESQESDKELIADAIRKHVTKNSAVAVRHVKVVDETWILKTSSGKTARSANKEKFLKEIGIH
ncbi:MAG: AMP-binding protein [Anaerolineales bacterium]|nr:AMP-binding protein [Anaerolineales bacterium]MBX3036934.1 AMP-binding protein [Anaerolineales bacterium]